MKKKILALLIGLTPAGLQATYAQNNTPPSMVRLYEDNDFLNDMGKGTDEAYSNGTRIDVFYSKDHNSGFFLDGWMPVAGDSSVNTFGTGMVEQMYTPSDIGNKYYQPHDYAWAGSLFATHSLYSFNPQKKYDYQTELVAGVIGPDAMAKQFQSSFHRLIQDPTIPQGWNNQYGNDLLLNVNITAEKQLAHISKLAELIGSGQIQIGTMTDGIDIGPILIIGKMNPYFNGFIGQYGSKDKGAKKNGHVQAYFKMKPGVKLVAWNSMLEGGMFNQKPVVIIKENPKDISGNQPDGSERQPVPEIENVVTYLTYSVVVVTGPFSIAYTQTHTSELVKNTYAHTYGNISIAYSW